MAPNLLNADGDVVALDRRDAETRSVRLTPATAADAEHLGSLFAGMLPWSRYPFSAAALEGYLAQREASAPRFSIWSGNQLAGALGLRLNWLRGPYVQFLGVLPQFQRAGLGRAVVETLTGDARALGERNVWVAASSFNADAVRFYERHGFVRCAHLDGLVQDGIDEVLLRKRL